MVSNLLKWSSTKITHPFAISLPKQSCSETSKIVNNKWNKKCKYVNNVQIVDECKYAHTCSNKKELYSTCIITPYISPAWLCPPYGEDIRLVSFRSCGDDSEGK